MILDSMIMGLGVVSFILFYYASRIEVSTEKFWTGPLRTFIICLGLISILTICYIIPGMQQQTTLDVTDPSNGLLVHQMKNETIDSGLKNVMVSYSGVMMWSVIFVIFLLISIAIYNLFIRFKSSRDIEKGRGMLDDTI